MTNLSSALIRLWTNPENLMKIGQVDSEVVWLNLSHLKGKKDKIKKNHKQNIWRCSGGMSSGLNKQCWSKPAVHIFVRYLAWQHYDHDLEIDTRNA